VAALKSGRSRGKLATVGEKTKPAGATGKSYGGQKGEKAGKRRESLTLLGLENEKKGGTCMWGRRGFLAAPG